VTIHLVSQVEKNVQQNISYGINVTKTLP